MTDNQREIYKRVFEKDAKRRQANENRRMREAIERRKAGKSLAGDYVYFKNNKQDKVAHQNRKIAHPDAMEKTSATILLIVGMLGSLIFKQWYLIWAVLLWWYFKTDRV